MKIPVSELEDLIWHVPERCWGQRIEYAYASHKLGVVSRVTDGDSRPDYTIALWRNVTTFEPWNEEPDYPYWVDVEIEHGTDH